MQPSKLIAGTRPRARSAITLLACVSLLAATAAFAQSGRRTPKQQPVAPVPTPTPEPTPLPKDDRPEVKIPLVVLSDDSGFYARAARESHTVQAVAVARLRESRALEVSGEDNRASRGEAIRRAKDSSVRHVVWFELRPDAGFETTTRRVPPERMLIEYTVYQAGTAKRMTGGTVHMMRARGPLGRAGVPLCYPVMTNEIEYVYGALEMAERIMESFSLAIPRRCG